jgi:Fe-S-cluster containining protein
LKPKLSTITLSNTLKFISLCCIASYIHSTISPTNADPYIPPCYGNKCFTFYQYRKFELILSQLDPTHTTQCSHTHRNRAPLFRHQITGPKWPVFKAQVHRDCKGLNPVTNQCTNQQHDLQCSTYPVTLITTNHSVK